MPWYRAGTVTATAGQTTITGAGTSFAANGRVGDALQGPDGRWYEVTNIASATVMSILPAYQGATVAGGSYGLAPMQGYVKESADRLRAFVEQFGGTLALFGGATDIVTLRGNIGAAKSGANSDITSLSGLTTPISLAQGGTDGGVNANGKYTRYPDGSMICEGFVDLGSVLINRSAGAMFVSNYVSGVPYPAGFTGVPDCIIQIIPSGGTAWAIPYSAGSGTMTPAFFVLAPSSEAQTLTLKFIAKGRWRA